jgi:eukaryotic-like serine/threonine-protein kinase
MTRPSFLNLLLILLCGCTTLSPLPTPTPEPSASPTSVPKPDIGSTWSRPADGMLMVFVPAGDFLMGSADGTIPSSDDVDEYPVHSVYLDAFWIDKTDVTNAMYARCVQTGTCLPPASNQSETRDSYYENPDFDNYPVMAVSWTQANAYCQWAGAVLPSEAQWEKAARGTDGRIYPWGNDLPTCSRANFGGKTGCAGDTTAVDSHPDGASPYGALDMAGNLWQWVVDWYDGNYYAISPTNNPTGPDKSSGEDLTRVLRGGSWLAEPEWIRSTNRVDDGRNNWSNLQGFRCARPSP